MVGNKLISHLRKEIKKYLGIPYWVNHWENNVLINEGVFGGKGNISEIEYATRCAAEKEKINLRKLSKEQIYQLRKRNGIGIDCSGLTYHLCDKLDQLKGNFGIIFKVTGINETFGILGIRSVSANALTDPKNAVKINSYDDIECGDLIRFNNGRHVILIVEIKNNIIHYIHSSDRTKERGVHYGFIEITNPQKSLRFQKWSEKTLTGKKYNDSFHPIKGDGIFRLKCFV